MSISRRIAEAHVERHARQELPGVARGDSWMNGRTGIGTWADKTMHGRFVPVFRIMDQELTSLYNGSALAAKVVEKRPREMFRRGYEVECDDLDASACKDLREYALEEFHVDDEFLKAKIFANLYGGFATLLGIDDGNMPDEALDESRIRSFTFLNGVDRRFTYVLDYYDNPFEPKFGQPKHYLVTNAVSISTTSTSAMTNGLRKVDPNELRKRGYGVTVVHESRILRWEGVSTDQVTQQTLAGWTWSALQRVYDSLRKFEHAFDSAMYLLADASQGVASIKGLMDAIGTPMEKKLRQRLAFLDEMRSVMRTIMIATDEKYERQPTPFAGIPDLLDKAMLRFAGDVDMPVTELFGRAPAGMNATGESDVRKWYDTIASEQPTQIAPPLKRFYRLLTLSRDCPVKLKKSAQGVRWNIKFAKLLTPTDKEQADMDLAIAQRDQIYIAEEVVTPEEVALDRQTLYPSMNVEAREAALEDAKAFDPYANEPDEILPGGETPSPNVGLPVPIAEPQGGAGTAKVAAPAGKPGVKKAAAAPVVKKTAVAKKAVSGKNGPKR